MDFIHHFHISKKNNVAIIISFLTFIFLVFSASGEWREPDIYGIFDGDPMYSVLPPGAIPAIIKPEFLTGKKAFAQMYPNEPVIGVLLGGEVKAYSMWQLDAHEIVNDILFGKAIAVTW